MIIILRVYKSMLYLFIILDNVLTVTSIIFYNELNSIKMTIFLGFLIK